MHLKNLKELKLVLPPLPFEKNTLLPFMSVETLDYHHGKHHQAYVNKSLQLLNINNQDIYLMEELQKIPHHPQNPLFFNLAQVLNHNLFWLSLDEKPISKEVKDFLASHFGSYEKFCENFITQGLQQIGSGWVWLLSNGEKVWITTTSNGDFPIEIWQEHISILTVCDICEHAYYLDYRNDRSQFLKIFVEHLMKLSF